MAWRAGIIAACLTLPNTTTEPAYVEGPQPADQRRQNIDAIEPKAILSTVTRVHETHLAESPPTEIDVASQPIDFNSVSLAQLYTTGSTTIYLPETGELELSLLEKNGKKKLAPGNTRVTHTTRFSQDGLVGTITQRADTFFMTLPTSSDSYRIQGDDHQAWAVSNRQLAQRAVNQEKDFQYAP